MIPQFTYKESALSFYFIIFMIKYNKEDNCNGPFDSYSAVHIYIPADNFGLTQSLKT